MSNTEAPVVAPTELLSCPFCGAVPEFYDGAHRVKHDPQCYLFDWSEYEWIIGRKGVSKWNARKPNPSLQGTGHLVDRTLQGVVRPEE